MLLVVGALSTDHMCPSLGLVCLMHGLVCLMLALVRMSLVRLSRMRRSVVAQSLSRWWWRVAQVNECEALVVGGTERLPQHLDCDVAHPAVSKAQSGESSVDLVVVTCMQSRASECECKRVYARVRGIRTA